MERERAGGRTSFQRNAHPRKTTNSKELKYKCNLDISKDACQILFVSFHFFFTKSE